MAKKATPPTPEEDLLAGVNEKTTRVVLLDKLREAVRRLHTQEDQRVARMQELEERVRAKFAGSAPVELRSVTVMCSAQEFGEMVDFLENFEDIMPIAMHRMLSGAKAVRDDGQPV